MVQTVTVVWQSALLISTDTLLAYQSIRTKGFCFVKEATQPKDKCCPPMKGIPLTVASTLRESAVCSLPRSPLKTTAWEATVYGTCIHLHTARHSNFGHAEWVPSSLGVITWPHGKLPLQLVDRTFTNQVRFVSHPQFPPSSTKGTNRRHLNGCS